MDVEVSWVITLLLGFKRRHFLLDFLLLLVAVFIEGAYDVEVWVEEQVVKGTSWFVGETWVLIEVV